MNSPPQQKNAITSHYYPSLAKCPINIATCCEGHILLNNAHSLEYFSMWLLSHSLFTQPCYSWQIFPTRSSSSVPFWLHKLCSAPRVAAPPHFFPFFPPHVSWTHQRGRLPGNAPHMDVDFRSVPVMDASSDVLYDTLPCKLISHGGLRDEHSVTLNKGLSD